MIAFALTAPVYLPEFDQTFSWAMCRNALCGNFGLHYTGETPTRENPVAHDANYRLQHKENKKERKCQIRCKRCGQSFHLRNNQAVRPLARHFLSLSLPFADCPNEQCGNHGCNVFEHYFEKGLDKRARSRYGRLGADHRVSCRECRTTLHLGEPLRLTVNLLLKRSLRLILEEVMVKSPPSAMIKKLRKLKSKMTENETDEIENVENESDDGEKKKKAPRRPDAYYNQLRSIGNRIRDHHAWRNARLLDPDLKTDRETPVRVYTDVMKVSMIRYGDGPRHQFLDLIVSVLATEPSPYILAIHPTFIPEKKSIDVMDILARADPKKVDYTDEWACLMHPGQIDIGNVREALREGQPDISRGGYFLNTIYAAAAHFLTVQKMLARFEKVYYYMDAARDLYPAALGALIEPIRAGKVEIALFQHEQEKKKDKKAKSAQGFRGFTQDEKVKRLATAYLDMEVRFREQVRAAGQIEGAEEDETLLRAAMYKHAIAGANTQTGGWAWLTYPPTSKQYRNPRCLWLTRMPHKTFEEHGRPLLLNATLQPADTIMSSMRRRVRGLVRPSGRAMQGISYMESYYRVDTLISEVWVYLMERNFRLPDDDEQEFIPAMLAKLMTESEAERVVDRHTDEDFRDIVLDFRLDLNHARRLSKWQR